MNKIRATIKTINDDSDLSKYGRAMLEVELKWLDLLGLIEGRCVIALILEHFSVQTTYLIMGW
jgi:hypothetical protein